MIRSLFLITCLSISLSPPVFGAPLSPESRASLEREGRLSEIVERRSAAFARGVDQPGANIMDSFGYPLRDPDVTLHVPVILVDFRDNEANEDDYPVDHYEELLFSQDELDPGSMREWYLENSYDRVDIVGVVVGWVRLPQTYEYYVGDDNGLGGWPNNSQRMTYDAVMAADDDVDFSDYDNDDDGTVDAIFIVHAGPGAEANGGDEAMIWSHAWALNNNRVRLDGVWIDGYTTEPDDGEVGVFGHELAHALFGLPDLYDRDYSSEGLGFWSMMAGGMWNGRGVSPAHLDAWSKIQAGFAEPEVIQANVDELTLQPVEEEEDIYIVWRDGEFDNEYFLVENRQQVGFDEELPGHGLLIYHVDEAVEDQNDNEWYPDHEDEGHYLVALEQADGAFDLEQAENQGGTADPYPGTQDHTVFDHETTPSSYDYDGDDTGVAVRNIEEGDGNIVCDIDIGRNAPVVEVEIADIEVDEDFEWHVVADLDTVFSDPDDDELEFILESSDEGVGVDFDDDGNLALFSSDNWNGEAEITIIADDLTGGERVPRRDLTVQTSFAVTVNAVNDAPVWDVLPEDRQVVGREGDPVEFELAAEDVDDNAGDLLIEMSDDGGLPDGYNFEVHDEFAAAQFFWEPGFDDEGEYNPVFTVSDGNLDTDLEIVITIEHGNRGPEIPNPIDDVLIDEDSGECEIADLDEVCIDPDEDELEFTVDAIEDLNAAIDAETHILTINPTENYNGESEVVISASDGIDEVFDFFMVRVNPVNDPPEVEMEIDDVNIEEDPDPRTIQIADLNGIFSDVDEDDDLNYSVGETPDELNLNIDEEDVLTMTPEQDFNLPDGVEVTVIARDEAGDSTATSFSITITPVNDLPSEFDLVAPSDSTVIEEMGVEVEFRWRRSFDVDGDDLTYILFFEAQTGGWELPINYVEDLQDTTYTVLVDTLAEFIGYDRHDGVPININWFLISLDGEEIATSRDEYILTIPVPNAVQGDQHPLPTEFSLSNVYPNPFNATTRLDFALPVASNITLAVWDVSGRRVELIESGRFAPGAHSTQWRGDGVPAGVYLFVLDYEGGRRIAKGALVK